MLLARLCDDSSMLVAFSITPLGVGESVSASVSAAVRLVRDRGVPYGRLRRRLGRLLLLARLDGSRARQAGGRRHDLAHLLDDQTDHRRGADDVVRARPFPAE